MFSNNSNTQGTNIFSKNQPQPQTQGNMFLNQSQNQGNNQFSGNRPQTGMFNNSGSNTAQNNIFNNNQSQAGSNNLVSGNQQQQGSTNFFNRTNTGTGVNLFNQGSNQPTTGNMFNQGGTTIFSQPNSNQTTGVFNNTYNQTGYNYNTGGYPINPNCPVNQAKVYEMINAPVNKQKEIFQSFQPDYLKQLINYYRKSVQNMKTERFQLTADNLFRNEKIGKVATSLNIKPQLIQMRKMLKDNSNKIRKLKDDKEKLDNISASFSKDVFQKLQKYKEKLVYSVTHSKMLEDAKKEIDQIELQIKEFFKPLFNSQQNRSNFTFFDPNPFCLNVSQKLLRNMTLLENRMDQILACQGDEENIDIVDVLMQLVEYYQNVGVALKDYTVKYDQLKRKALQRSRQSKPEEAFKKLTERASSIIKKQMQPYQIVKEIQSLLQKREKKMNERKD